MNRNPTSVVSLSLGVDKVKDKFSKNRNVDYPQFYSSDSANEL